ncbi:MAG: RidA family protein [Acidobacteriota bacterium]
MRQSITSASRYEPLFGFCRAIRTGNTIAIAGTAPIGDDGKTVGIGDPAAQARRCFGIILHALDELGGSPYDLVRTRMFLTRISDWETIGKVHGEYFGEIRPVSTMVEVSALIDPAWFIEVEADAIVGSA